MGRILWFLPDARNKLAFGINHNMYFHDLRHIRFWNEKSTYTQFAHPPGYNFWYTALFGVGVFWGVGTRSMATAPEMAFRRSEYYKPFPDRVYSHSWSLPYYNHWIRQWVSRWRATFHLNEPDFNAYHPWGIRPDRNLSYHRLPLIMISSKYFIDDPNFEKTLHGAMIDRYDALGYNNSRIGKKNRKKLKKMVEEGKLEDIFAMEDGHNLCYKYPRTTPKGVVTCYKEHAHHNKVPPVEDVAQLAA